MTHQGFAGSVGTSALLIGAALTILLAVGAVVAFEGFPGPSGEAPAETVLLESSGTATGRPDPELVLDAARAAGRDGSGETPGSAAASADFSSPSAAATPAAGAGAPLETGAGASPTVVGGGAADSSQPRSASGGSGSGEAGGGTVNRLADGVRETSGTLDRAVDRVLPGGGLGGTLDGALDGAGRLGG